MRKATTPEARSGSSATTRSPADGKTSTRIWEPRRRMLMKADDSFDAMFNRIAKRAEKKRQQAATNEPPARPLELGDTESGRSQLGGAKESERELRGPWNLREIPPSHGHAS